MSSKSVLWSLLAGQPVPRLARWRSPSGGSPLLRSCSHSLPLLATFSLVVEGEGFRTLEDTGLRCVINGALNGALVWVTRVDSRKVTVHPTNREIGSVFAGQIDRLQGEAPGKTWALPWWCLSMLTFPNLLGSHVLIHPAELVYLKLVALQRFILSLSLSVWPVLT